MDILITRDIEKVIIFLENNNYLITGAHYELKMFANTIDFVLQVHLKKDGSISHFTSHFEYEFSYQFNYVINLADLRNIILSEKRDENITKLINEN